MNPTIPAGSRPIPARRPASTHLGWPLRRRHRSHGQPSNSGVTAALADQVGARSHTPATATSQPAASKEEQNIRYDPQHPLPGPQHQCGRRAASAITGNAADLRRHRGPRHAGALRRCPSRHDSAGAEFGIGAPGRSGRASSGQRPLRPAIPADPTESRRRRLCGRYQRRRRSAITGTDCAAGDATVRTSGRRTERSGRAAGQPC